MQKGVIPSAFIPEKLIVLWAESPLYIGGERETGTIDLKLQREPITGLPIIRSTSLKGAIRSYLELTNVLELSIVNKLFGTTDEAGNVLFMDAKIFLFPVRANYGHFVYVTSLYSLQHLAKLLSYIGRREDAVKIEKFIKNSDIPPGKALYFDGSIFDELNGEKKIFLLDEFALTLEKSEDDIKSIIVDIVKVDEIGYVLALNKVEKALLVLRDEDFKMIIDRGLMRVTRIRLDKDTKTVERGALFFQELLPEYTVLISGLFKSIRAKSLDTNSLVNALHNNLIVLGGDETVGRGIVRFKLYP